MKAVPRLRPNIGDSCRIAALRSQRIVLQRTFLAGLMVVRIPAAP